MTDPVIIACFLVAILATNIGRANSEADATSFCPDVCGKAEEEVASTTPPSEDEKKKAEAAEKDDDHKARIINGWNAKPRPWMVLIRATNPEDSEDFDTCGGAIINKRYVLTAGHCVCLVHSRITACDDGNMDYNAKDIMKVFIGLNDANVKEVLPRNKDMYEYEIESVIKHPDWTGTGLTFPDLSLLKTAKEIKFLDSGKSSVLPICLPPPDMQILGRRGYVAGWGLTRNEDCFTDDFGPDRHTRCRFPFMFKGLPMDSCLEAETPTASNKRCMQFKQTMGAALMPKKGESIMIKYGHLGKKKTICYHTDAGRGGWCGTCRRDAEPNSYGYCPDGMPPPEDDALVTVAKPSREWGFCSKLCKQEEMRAVQLQETGLTVLDEEACATFNTSQLTYRSEVEFCGGNKMAFPTMKMYRRYKKRGAKKDDEKTKYTFVLEGSKKNTLGALKKHSELGYYLGQTDSCQGDSGGPFYIFEGKTAYVVGVVSRGGQCAGFNQPGIYTNLLYKKWTDWIKENSKDGDCK